MPHHRLHSAPSVLLAFASAALLLACSAGNSGGNGSGASSNDGGSGATSNTGGTDNPTGPGSGGNGGSTGEFMGVGGGTVQPGCDSGPNDDKDLDGFTPSQGDCNDCDKNANPGAIEVIGDTSDPDYTPADEDCDGTSDVLPALCDGSLTLADTDAMNGARAMDLCQTATAGDKKWGVLDAKYVRANGSNFSPSIQAGLQSNFGSNVSVRKGSRMLMLSSGNARLPNQSSACGALTCTHSAGGTPPPGFPQDNPNCPPSTNINDDVGLELKIRSPTNATGYSFDFKFYSFEFPEYVCDSYNDQFIALVTPPPQGSINGNISFDNKGNAVSVNLGFFDVCDPGGQADYAYWCNVFGGNCPNPPVPYCPSGAAELTGTGFDTWDSAGATVWLKSQAPVTGGQEFTVRFAIWDTGDQALDSSVIVDNFAWIANGATVSVGTTPVPQ
ncbi:MAG: choice-of-anchor L domain-containing protein [Polyangiaceae bacterium]